MCRGGSDREDLGLPGWGEGRMQNLWGVGRTQVSPYQVSQREDGGRVREDHVPLRGCPPWTNGHSLLCYGTFWAPPPRLSFHLHMKDGREKSWTISHLTQNWLFLPHKLEWRFEIGFSRLREKLLYIFNIPWNIDLEICTWYIWTCMYIHLYLYINANI